MYGADGLDLELLRRWLNVSLAALLVAELFIVYQNAI